MVNSRKRPYSWGCLWLANGSYAEEVNTVRTIAVKQVSSRSIALGHATPRAPLVPALSACLESRDTAVNVFPTELSAGL